jgi:Meiotically up-regulated gene 113
VTRYIYVIGADQPPYKVGVAKNPEQRLKALQTGHPKPLRLIHKIATDAKRTHLLEAAMHRNMRHYQQTGEWFDMPLERLLAEVEFVIIRYEEDNTLGMRLRQNII